MSVCVCVCFESTVFVTGVPIGIFQSMFQVVAMDTFKLEPDQNGYIMSYIGIIAMVWLDLLSCFESCTFKL